MMPGAPPAHRTGSGVRQQRLSGHPALQSPALVALVVALFYGLWIISVFLAGHQARDFIVLGRDFVGQSHRSVVITVDPHYDYLIYQGHYVGYDGQFCYYLAADPANARYYMDAPAYRYTRVLYPLAARALALGNPDVIPYTLIVINWLALSGGTLAVAAWLRRKGLSAWLALLYGFYPGFLVSLQRDLTEIVAYSLVALAIYLFEYGGRHRVAYAGVSFALAVLTREVSALFALLYGLSLLWDSSATTTPQRPDIAAYWRRALLFMAIVATPMLLYKAFLLYWLGSLGLVSSSTEIIPLHGLVALWPWTVDQVTEIVTVVCPSLILAAMGLWAVRRRAWHVEVWALLTNILLFMLMLGPLSYSNYNSSGRIISGVVLAGIYCLPTFDRLTAGRRWWLWSSGFLLLCIGPAGLLRPLVSHVMF